MKKIMMLACILTLCGAGCAQPVPDVEDQDTQQDSMNALEEMGEEMDDVLGAPGLDLYIENPDMEVEPDAEETDGGDVADQEEVPDVKSLSMTSGNFFFEPASIRVAPGEEVEILFAENEGVHTFVIDEIGLNVPINEGASVTFTAPSDPGTYSFYCSIGNHRALGMEGVLIVK